MMRCRLGWPLPALLAALASVTVPPVATGQGLTATDRDKIGLTALDQYLSGAAPTGAGIDVVQVEAPLTSGGSNYLPNALSLELLGVSITDLNLTGTVSTHATSVAQGFYGSNGVAPGVDSADVYNANLWINSSFLRTTNWRAPLVSTGKVINHSWIGSFTADSAGIATATDLLRRLDYVVNRDNVVMVAGVNNGVTPFPQILGNAYNVITVGLTSGNSSAGPSTIDLPGRTKPDIVVPAPNTSQGTAWVSGAAAVLLEVAGADPYASRPETIKAALLAGAVKTPFDTTGATPTEFDDWSHTPEHPLDYQYGAGQLNVLNSYRILSAGQQPASATQDVAPTGWDLAQFDDSAVATYYFEIPEGYLAPSFSAVATWNREIDFQQGISYAPAILTPSLADVNLFLHTATGFQQGSLLDTSISAVDNVEHIYQTWLTAGRYEIGVTTDQAVDVAVAWNAQLVMLGDASGDGVVDAGDYTLWADNFLATGATWGQADFNLDGVVDAGDYTLWANHFLGESIFDTLGATTTFSAVPEPSALALAVLGLGSLGLSLLRKCWRRSNRR